MSDVKWAIATQAFEKPGYPKIVNALVRAGIEFHNSSYDFNTRQYDPIPDHFTEQDTVVLYGPIQFVRSNLQRKFQPGAFGFKTRETLTSVYMTSAPLNMFFNQKCIYLPWGMIPSSHEMIADLVGDDVFIRPDSGFKSFTGFNSKLTTLQFEMNSLRQTNNPDPSEMCLISPAKQITGEYRFVICQNKVVSGSQYRWDDKFDVRLDVPQHCWDFAEKVAELDWQLDTCYVVDIFMDEHGVPYIGEYNSFSSAGLYHCNMDKIVDAVTKAAIDEKPQ